MTPRVRGLWLIVVMLMACGTAGRAPAHALEPGYLEILPLADAEWRVTWRKPQVAGQPMQIDAVLPENCTPRSGPPPRFDGRAFVSGWAARCDGSITSAPLTIDGLDRTATDVLVRFVGEPDAPAQTLRLTPNAPSALLPPVPSRLQVLTSYFGLGVEHILSGLDHLLFVLALLMLIRDVRRLVAAVTAFTVAHSITLAASALGLVTLPMPPVEAVIALSIVFLASEIVASRDGKPRLTEQRPWTIPFAFGLLHGLGFASALREIGLPEGEIPVALLAFNLGVEAGQLLFIAAVLLLIACARLVSPALVARQLLSRSPTVLVTAYAIGGIAAYWTIDRVVGFFA